MGALKNLFSPIQIGSLTAKNRLLMSAMSINFGVDDDLRVTDQLTDYFVARARGGTGMMLVGGGAVHPSGLELPKLPALWSDDCIGSLKKMVEAVKPHEACFGVQLMHGGRQSYHDQKVAPSPIPAPAVVKGIPKELTIDGIEELVASFGDAARRCREAGFDFIEIHGAHGYLINQFMAPNSNHRQDEYGGSFENRIRFLVDLFRDIQAKAGDDFPVGVRFNGNDYIKDGWTLTEAIRLAKLLETEGAAYLHVSAGVYGSTELTIPSMYVAPGCFVPMAEAVKASVAIPVVTVGRIKTAAYADEIIGQGKADIVAMGRALLADPALANKALAGKSKQTRPCIGCCLGCIHQVIALEPGSCVVNPDVGREYQLDEIHPVSSPKKVLVIGAGPAGLATARMAALRDHQVTVWEENEQVGGLARLAAVPPGRGEIFDIIEFFDNELKRLNVPVKCGAALTPEKVNALAPDEIVLASGSLPEMPIIKGLFQTQLQLCTVIDVLEETETVGQRVIVLGGGQIGMVLADYLAEQNKEVVLLNRRRHFAEEMSSNDRFYLRERLKCDNVQLYKQVAVKKFLPDGVVFLNADKEKIQLTDFNSVVIAEKMTPIRQCMEFLKKIDCPVHMVGDAKSPRIIMHAIAEGEEIGRSI